jgi:hypothetical protein
VDAATITQRYSEVLHLRIGAVARKSSSLWLSRATTAALKLQSLKLPSLMGKWWGGLGRR